MIINPEVVSKSTRRLAPKLRGLLDKAAKSIRDVNSPERLRMRMRQLSADGAAPSGVELERMLGDNDLVDLNYLERGLEAARAVCRILLGAASGTRRGFATGFMVSPSLLLTNHHVFPDDAAAQGSLIEFSYEYDLLGQVKPTEQFRLNAARFFWAREDLDFAIVAVDPEPIFGRNQLSDFGWLRLNPELGKINELEFVSIIQHPSGQPKQLAIRENQLVDLGEGEAMLTYVSDTAPGSSGSPLFNDSWQVVGIHHSGVPRKNDKGEFLRRDGTPAPADADDSEIQWIANEGVRTSYIVKAIAQSAPAGALRDEFLGTTRQAKTAVVKAAGIAEGKPAERAAAGPEPTVPATGEGVLINVPIYIRLGGAPQISFPKTEPAAPAVIGKVPSTPAGEDSAEEAFVIDTNYSRRRGYDPMFLGVDVPLPSLTEEAMQRVALDGTRRGQQDSHVLKYHHFSLVFNRERRLLFFAAGNFNPSKRGKKSRSGLGSDHWIPDPRIDRALQIEDKELYAGTDFDLGHVVKRQDNYWGDTDEEAVYSNWDTFHYTNCTPQHLGYNRASEGGLWGKLEDYISKQTAERDGKLAVFAGPVLAASDRVYRDVKIPKQFWKVLVTMAPAGKLQAYGFLLSQAELVRDMEAEFSPGEYKQYQVPLKKIEAMTEVRFPQMVAEADVMAEEPVESAREFLKLESLAERVRAAGS